MTNQPANSKTVLSPIRMIKIILIFSTLLATSCFKGKTNIQIPKVEGPTVKIVDNKVLIDATFIDIPIDEEKEFTIPSFTKSKLTLSPNGSGGTFFNVSLFLEEILEDADFRDPQTLPGGRALPGIATGTIPGISFTIPSFHNITVYVGKNFFGIFYPLSLDLDIGIVNSRFYLGKKTAGTLSLVGQDQNNENSGFLLLLKVDDNTRKYLKRVLRKYNELQ